MRSNACVFKGRWQYEVQLGSAGILQVRVRAQKRAASCLPACLPA